MARKKSLDSKVKSLVEKFAADLLPLLRTLAEEEIAAQQKQCCFHFEDGGTLGDGSVPPVSEDALDSGELVEFDIEVIPDTQRGPDEQEDEDTEIPQTIYPT